MHLLLRIKTATAAWKIYFWEILTLICLTRTSQKFMEYSVFYFIFTHKIFSKKDRLNIELIFSGNVCDSSWEYLRHELLLNHVADPSCFPHNLQVIMSHDLQ